MHDMERVAGDDRTVVPPSLRLILDSVDGHALSCGAHPIIATCVSLKNGIGRCRIHRDGGPAHVGLLSANRLRPLPCGGSHDGC